MLVEVELSGLGGEKVLSYCGVHGGVSIVVLECSCASILFSSLLLLSNSSEHIYKGANHKCESLLKTRISWREGHAKGMKVGLVSFPFWVFLCSGLGGATAHTSQLQTPSGLSDAKGNAKQRSYVWVKFQCVLSETKTKFSFRNDVTKETSCLMFCVPTCRVVSPRMSKNGHCFVQSGTETCSH